MSSTGKIEILVHGLGAIGSFYAFILQRSPRVRLSVTARSNFTAVSTHGLQIHSENHGTHAFRPAATLRHPSEARPTRFDYVVCANKATDLAQTVRDLEPVVDGTGRTAFVLMQNGVGNEDPFHARFPSCPVLSGVVWVGATQTSPGVVRQHVSESTTIGLYTPPDRPEVTPAQRHALDEFTSLLREGGTPFEVPENIQTARWRKCVWNCAWNALTTLGGLECQAWLGSSEYAMRTTRRLLLEGIAVARAEGVPGIEDQEADELIGKMLAFDGPVWTSMYHDSRAGRAMEVDIILGSIVKKGRARGLEVPTLETLYALLLAVQARIDEDNKNNQNQ